jgi:hypothetical protein
MRADQIRPGYKASNGATVVRVATTYDPENANDGITTFWWDDGMVTYTAPWHQLRKRGDWNPA